MMLKRAVIKGPLKLENFPEYFIRTMFVTPANKKQFNSEELIAKEKFYCAHNYEPVPVVIAKGEGTVVYDSEGRRYLDFLAGYASLNLGHTHPRILKALTEQASILSHTSRAFYNNVLPHFCEHVAKFFQYDRVLTMNTGVEGVETAVKIARRWGYQCKKIPENKAKVIFVEGNFWGRTMSAISTSSSVVSKKDFGPFMPGFEVIPFDDVDALEKAIQDQNVCAFVMEPIQGEAGVRVPTEGYLKEIRRLCSKYNVLWVTDEVQTGVGRTGKLLAVEHEQVRADVLIIGKGLGGGFLPISAVMTSHEIMSLITPGSHGSTFGGNPLATRVAMETLNVMKEENLIKNAYEMGSIFRSVLKDKLPSEVILQIRGKGLMNGLCLNPDYGTAWELCLKLKDLGLLCKPCDEPIIRFTPPLNITSEHLHEGLDIIIKAVNQLEKKK